MIKSLRSLCLLEVSSLGHSYKDLPSELVKELDKMKLFNGNFSFEDNKDLFLTIQRAALTITYDGVSWTFQSRSQYHYRCRLCIMAESNNRINCGGFQPELHKFTVAEAEGETVPGTSPFSWVRSYWMEAVENKQQQLGMQMSVYTDKEGIFGEIVFSGCGDGEPVVNSSIKVYLREGSRVMLHSWEDSYNDIATMEPFNTLAESSVSAEDAFKCHGLVESYDDFWDESYDDFWDESNDDSLGDDDWYLHDNDSHIDSENLNIDLNEDSMLESFNEFWVMIQNS